MSTDHCSLITDHSPTLTLSQAAARIPGRPHNLTVYRWITKGVTRGRGPKRCKVYLDAVKVGGMWRISEEAIAAFIAGCTPARPEPEDFTARKRKREAVTTGRHNAAMQRLRAQGVI